MRGNKEDYWLNQKESKNDIVVLRKKRGRYRTTGSHNKFSDDNIRRKCKHLILQSVMEYINEKIKNAVTAALDITSQRVYVSGGISNEKG